MAPRNAAAAAARAELQAAEREERELNDDINEAIARTDSEVFTDAMGDEPIDEDTDTSLEDMGEGLEGDDVEDDAPPGDEEVPPGDDEQPPPDERRPQPSIPPRVLRETRERFREQEADWQSEMRTLREQNRDLQMRIDNLSRQPAQPAQPQQQKQEPPKPDRWADPEGYDAWLEQRAERRAQETATAQMREFRAEQQKAEENRLNELMRTTAQGPRGYEFNVAFQDLTSLDRTPANAQLVTSLMRSPDPGSAILDWWERSSNPEYIEWHRDQIRQTYGVQQAPPRRAFRHNGVVPQRGGYGPNAGQHQVRHEVRLPRSLSSASGATSQHLENPDYDDSEASVFSYGAQR